MISNSIDIAQVFSCTDHKSDAMCSERAFVHWYDGEGALMHSSAWAWIPPRFVGDNELVVKRFRMLISNPTACVSGWDHSEIWEVIAGNIQRKPRDFYAIKWVKAHTLEGAGRGHGPVSELDQYGNDRADALAKEGARANALPQRKIDQHYALELHTVAVQAMLAKCVLARYAIDEQRRPATGVQEGSAAEEDGSQPPAAEVRRAPLTHREKFPLFPWDTDFDAARVHKIPLCPKDVPTNWAFGKECFYAVHYYFQGRRWTTHTCATTWQYLYLDYLLTTGVVPVNKQTLQVHKSKTKNYNELTFQDGFYTRFRG